MVNWRPAVRADIEYAIRLGMTEPVGIDAAGIRAMASVGIDRSIDCRAYFVEGRMVCVIGLVVENLMSDECHLWAVFMPASKAFPKIVARHTKAYVEALPYDRVTCLCDPAFAKTVGWVRWMGFTRKGEAVIMGRTYDLYERVG